MRVLKGFIILSAGLLCIALGSIVAIAFGSRLSEFMDFDLHIRKRYLIVAGVGIAAMVYFYNRFKKSNS